MNKKLTIGFTSIVLAGTLGFGAIASASGNGGGTGTGTGIGQNRPHLTTEEKCAKSDEIVAKATAAQQKIADRIATLQERRTKAEAAGKTDLVAKIDTRLARLDALNTKITERLAKFQTWVTTNCTA
ncbi:MAG: hypothetical protein WCK21_12365 [Actinomycetota bacterium]